LIDVNFRETLLGPNFYEPILGRPEQFKEYVRAEPTKSGKVIQDAKLSVNSPERALSLLTVAARHDAPPAHRWSCL
jgi:hypothetical protein